MARRKPTEEHANHERWLVSYADFMTLMFAFFVVMFASAQADRAKAQEISASVRKAIEEGGIPSALRDLLRGTPAAPPHPQSSKPTEHSTAPLVVPPPATVDLQPSMGYLKLQLQDEILSGKVQVAMEGRGIVISLRESGFFPSGTDTLYPAAYESMGKIAQVVHNVPNPVRLEGHTDSVPIHTARFHNNWELSSARAIAVLEFFFERYHIPTQRFAVAGYADNLPVATNESEEGRGRNRRVDIVILNSAGLRNENGPNPAKHGGSGTPAVPAPAAGRPPGN
jgi:chemotaxis protein MotB